MYNYTGDLNSTALNIRKAPTTSSECAIPEIAQGSSLVVINFVLVIIGTIGNLFIIFAVLETPQLRKRPSNTLLMSLAFADMLVALCSQTLHGIWLSFATFSHRCVSSINLTYDISVSFLCCCSLFQLCIISIDRAISVLKPHSYRDIMSKKVTKRIVYGCWIASFLNACTRIPFPKYNQLVGLVIFFGGYLVFIFCYGAIIYKVIQSNGPNQVGPEGSSSSARDRAMERRVCEAVGIVTLIFSLCWLPVFIYLMMAGGNTNDITYSWFRTLYLANSSVNFIVYSWRIQQFRRAYARIINRILRRFRELAGLTVVSTGASVGNSVTADNVIKSEDEKKAVKTAVK